MRFTAGVLTLICFLLVSGKIHGQATTDSQLAAHYYQQNEFDKAAMYYKRLYDKDHSTFHYNYYLRCLFELKDYDAAEKVVKYHSRLYPNDYRIKVDLGIVYTRQGNTKLAQKTYKKLIDKVIPSYEAIHGLAQAFVGIDEFQLALQTYKRGDALMRGGYPFNIEKAEVYAQLGDYTSMFDELLALLELNSGYLAAVQTSLVKYSSFESGSEQNEVLKGRLIRLINQNPDQTLYSELLLWLYQQEGNWSGALIQTKALDRRKRANGQMVYQLAETLINNKQYDLCVEACNYVLEMDDDSPFYIESRILMLEAGNLKITESGDYSEEDIVQLLGDYDAALNELGRNVSTVSVIQEKAVILSFYRHDLDSGLNTFEEALAIPGVSETERASIKLDYGDALLAGGFIWDASLVYGQVDKKFKYDRLGEKAKLRSAKVHFYTGNFTLAKAQLDILKGSTSKLIANDAMQLSILITDNSTVDTTTKPLKMYADASLLLIQNKVKEATEKLDSINDQYPGHALDDDILYLRYEIEFEKREYQKASKYLEQIISAFSYDILADKAVFHLAELNENYLDNSERAKELYEVILLDYQDSLYATEARKRFRKLRGDQIN